MTEAERLLLLLVADAMMHTAGNALPHELVYRIMDARRALDDEAHLAALQASMAPVRSSGSGQASDAVSDAPRAASGGVP